MPVRTIEYRDEAERLGLEQAIAFFTPMRQTTQTASDGTVLAISEQVALNEGRALLRSTLAAAVPSRVDGAAQKGRSPFRRLRLRPHGPPQREPHTHSPNCGGPHPRAPRLFPLSTLRSRRLRCRPRVRTPRQTFGQGEQLLRELVGWQLDEETIRHLWHKVAAHATATRAERVNVWRGTIPLEA